MQHLNKKLFLCLLFVGLFPLLVSGLETQVISVSDCVNLNVELMNTTLPVDNGEYSFKDCTQNESLWNCNCDGDYNLILLTNITTLNTYDFRINYTTKYTTQSTRRGGGGGSWKPLNISIPNITPYLNTTYNITYITSILESPRNNTNPITIYQPPIQTQPQTQNESEWNGEVDGSKFPTALIIIIGIVVIIAFGLMKILSFGNKPKKPIYIEPKTKINPKWRQ